MNRLKNYYNTFFLFCTVILSLFCSTKVHAKDNQPNILLFTIDACRPDHLGCYGHPRNKTPNIDKLAREGVLFLNAFSQSAWTTPGMISIFTSMYPFTHKVDARGKTLDDNIQTLPEVLKQHGYVTPALPRFINIPNYWNLGFEKVDKERFQGQEGEDLLKLLHAYKDKTFFIWYHYHGLHLPYNTSAQNSPADSEGVALVKKKSVIKHGSVIFQDEDKRKIIALYDAQIKQLDDYIGRLFEKIRICGLAENTIVVVTSDHGEELFEHEFIGHASTSLNAKLYDEIIRIPLIIWWPKEIRHKKIDAVAQQTDIMPTLLDILGIPVNKDAQGRSLLPFITHKGTHEKPTAVFCETNMGGYQSTPEMQNIKLRCIRTKRWKLITGTGKNKEKDELYDLKNDPGEKQNVLKKHPYIASHLKTKLLRKIKTSSNAR